ncbi:DUF6011 domain-containing protein [Nocardia takedensis]|uniref:DUF6011 domain-containing protein n=1 Tax=Nocardia takedensis TaxID=259390 RepID=UPI003F75DBA8
MTDDDPDALVLPDGTPARVAVQCRLCRGWLVAPRSVAARIGPVCRGHEADAARRAAEPGLFEITTTQT